MERLKIKTCTSEEKEALIARCVALDIDNGEGLPFIFRVEPGRILITDRNAYYREIDRGGMYFDDLALYVYRDADTAHAVYVLMTLLKTTLKDYL